MKLILLLATFFLAINGLEAQQLTGYTYTNSSNDLMVDQHHIWVATRGVLLQYTKKGKLVKQHTVLDGLQTNQVTLAKGLSGETVVQACHDCTILYLKDNKWIPYLVEGKTVEGRLLNIDHVFAYRGDQFKVYYRVAVNGKLKSYNTNQRHLSNTEAIAVGNQNDLWMYLENNKIGRHNGKLMEVIDLPPKYNYKHNDNKYYIRQMVVDDNGLVHLLQQYEKEVLTYDPSRKKWSTRIDLSGSSASNLWLDSKGNLYFRDYHDVIYKLPNLPTKNSIGDAEVLLNTENKISEMAADPTGAIYFHDDEQRLVYCYANNKMTTIKLELPPNGMSESESKQLIQDSKGNWYTDDGLLLEFKSVDFKLRRVPFSSDWQHVNLIEGRNKALYCNGNDGVYVKQLNAPEWTKLDFAGVRVVHIYFDTATQNMYFLTNQGEMISEDSSGKITRKQLFDQKLERTLSIHNIHWTDKGGFWIVADKNLYYGVLDSKEPLRSIRSVSTNFVHFLGTKNGDIWLHESNKLGCWNGKEWTYFEEDNSPVLGGLSYKDRHGVRGMIELPNGNIVLQNRAGIHQYDGKQWTSKAIWQTLFVPQRINQYLTRNGGLYLDKKGRMWVNTYDGAIYRCDNNDCQPILKDTQVFISYISEDEDGGIWFLLEDQEMFLHYQD